MHEDRLVDSKPVYLGKLIRLYQDTFELPDGSQVMREIVHHQGAVAVVPLLPDRRVVLVRQFRGATRRAMLEVPAGTLEPDEAPEAAAIRELQEEAGYRPGTLTRLGGEYTAPGYTSEYIHLFLATGLQESRLAQDDDERIETVIMPFEQALGAVFSGAIEDGKTMIGLLMVARRLAEESDATQRPG